MRKKRRVQTFKNWLLARDAASRISTKSNYTSFLESSTNSEIDYKEAMKVFDLITTTSEFYKFQNNFADLGIWKITTPGEIKRMQLSLNKKYFNSNFYRFLKLLGIKDYTFPEQIDIEIDSNLSQVIQNKGVKTIEPTLTFLKFVIKPTFDLKEINQISQLIISSIVDSFDLKSPYKKDMLKNWVEKSVLQGSKYDNPLRDFESAFVDWMKTAPKDERANAYYEILTNGDEWDKANISQINSLMKESGIEIPNKEDIDLGSNVLKRFTS